MDPWTRNRWRRRWRRIRPLIVATVLAVLTVLILLAIAQHLEGAGRAGRADSNEECPPGKFRAPPVCILPFVAGDVPSGAESRAEVAPI
jgi:hypothetical protein